MEEETKDEEKKDAYYREDDSVSYDVEDEEMKIVEYEAIIENQTDPIQVNEKNEDDKGHNVKEYNKNMERDSLLNRVMELESKLSSRLDALQMKMESLDLTQTHVTLL